MFSVNIGLLGQRPLVCNYRGPIKLIPISILFLILIPDPILIPGRYGLSPGLS